MKKIKNSFFKRTKSKIKNFSQDIGPGLITGFADNDPSGIGTYSASGAKFGLSQLWLIPFQIPLMIAIQEMCARLGLVTGEGLASNIKKRFSKKWLYFCVLLLVFANIFNIGADIAAMASVSNILIGGNIYFWGLFITLVIILMEIMMPYRSYSKFLKWLTLPFIAYFITAFIVPQDWAEIMRSIALPSIQLNKEYMVLLVGFLGTTISPYLFFWQASEEVEEEIKSGTVNGIFTRPKRLTRRMFGKMKVDTVIGMVLSQLTTFFIVITCAATLFKSGVFEINSATDAALALEPLVGSAAFLLFSVGILGAGFLGIPTLAGSAGYAVSETFGWKEGLSLKFKEASRFYGIIAIATLVGLFINVLGFNPMRVLVYSAVINGIAAVPLIAFIILLTNNKKIMGKHVNKLTSRILGWITFVAMLLASVLMFVYW